MTFDFSQDWLEPFPADETCASAMPARLAVSPLAPLRPSAPPHPSLPEMVVLVKELFTEGTLTWHQLRSLGCLPELAAHLGERLAAVPQSRRVLATKR